MKKKVTINLSSEAITEIQRIAKEERRSVSAMIEELIYRRYEYAKQCTKMAFNDGYAAGVVNIYPPNFEDWWSNYLNNDAGHNG